MKSVPKLIRRFVGILLLSMILLFLLNILVIATVGLRQTSNASPYKMADKIGGALRKNETGYSLDQEYIRILEEEKAWAILIDDKTHEVIWKTDDLSEEIPLQYSLSAVSDFTLGYIRDYPTYVGDSEDGIIVIGYPKDRYWKHMWPSWDYDFIAGLPRTMLIALLCNVMLIFLIYIAVTGKLIRSVKPIIAGIRSLTTEERVRLKEIGVFSELSASINQTACLLENQERCLAKKERARANWIAGVSHDIRTPLSMVMGCAAQLEDNGRLPEEERKKAGIILRQSEKMRNLINDLNLASKLEYDMQPLHKERMNAVSVVRQVAVDFMNLDIEGRYPIEWLTDENLTCCILDADKELIKRAVGNLIQNSINHNEGGCTIYITVKAEEANCTVIVSDNGKGADDELIRKLNHAPHYMVCDENTSGQRHGLGLLIVKQIIAAHGGEIIVGHGPENGFSVELVLPMEMEVPLLT